MEESKIKSTGLAVVLSEDVFLELEITQWEIVDKVNCFRDFK